MTEISSELYLARAAELERKAAKAKSVEARADLFVVAACLRNLAFELQQTERGLTTDEPKSWK